MTDWVTVSQVGTAVGTLVLALATFSSVRSGARTARIAERSLLLGIRPVLAPARPGDPDETIGFGDGHRTHISGANVTIDRDGDRYYMAMSLRNVGPGLAVLHAWHMEPGSPAAPTAGHPDLDAFRRLQRDIYVPAGDLGFWQGAVRDAEDPFRPGLGEAIRGRERLLLDLLYGDHEGGQRTITRFGILPDDDGPAWISTVLRHWTLDTPDVR